MGTPLSWHDGLSSEQARAASHIGSHARLLAGPGTGKTHTLAGRVAYLITQQGVEPSAILVLTFTRLATRQLRSKIGERIAGHADGVPHIYTLHSFALRQLRRNANLVDVLPQPLRIADDWEERELIQEEMKLLVNKTARQVRQGFALLSADWQTLDADAEDWRQNAADPEFIGAWEEHRTIYGYTLRAELVYQLKKALEQVPSFTLKPEFQHVLIDEYQDLNPCDLAIARAIAGRGASLVACGDDDQSIYGFRFADPRGIRNFLTQFGGSAGLELTECWRCGANILEAALRVAQQDPRRVVKALYAAGNRPPGEVRLLSFHTGTEEAQAIAQLCRKYIDSGTLPGQILILVRSNHNGAYSSPVFDELKKLGVPVTVGAEKRTVLDEKPGRRFLSMLRLIVNPLDHLAWRSRLHLTDGIGPATVTAIYEFARSRGIGFGEALSRVGEFVQTIPAGSRAALGREITDANAAAQRFVQQLAQQNNSDRLSSEDLKGIIDAVSLVEIADEDGREKVVTYINSIVDASGVSNLEDLLVLIAVGREETDTEPDQDSINLLSMHQAKGLTAEVVFVMAVEDEILPQRLDGPSIEDDRRLLYVSMTRAREKLIMTYAGMRTGRQQHSGRNSGDPRRSISRFLRNGPVMVERGNAFVQAND